MAHSSPVKFPDLLHHKPSGRAYVMARTGSGKRKPIYLGVHGSEESRKEYARFIARLAAQAPSAVAPTSPKDDPAPDRTLNEVAVDFARHVSLYYPPKSSEARTFRLTMRPMVEFFGHLPAVEFGPKCLKAVQKHFVGGGLSRKEVNRRTGMVKRMFKWLAAEELVPASVYQALTAVEGLRRGRSTAAESEPVLPVSDELVERTLPVLNRYVAGMVQVQRLSGCRPGELCRLRMADVVKLERVWLYEPAEHKGAHRGKKKVIVIGPRAQAILEPFLPPDPTDYVFSPVRAVGELLAARTARRKTPHYPSHMARNAAKRKADRKRPPRACYTSSSYAKSIVKAVQRANAKRPSDDQIPHWHPHQLRHSFATVVRKRQGLEAAQASLGHDRMSTTEIYAEKNLGLAIKVAEENG
ncbi:tyrosine-type recombinase/integrase [Limnoglobus roseus]|uniref:tyrosine-type recombinase/integrase n=1 Tax=Limnoglobus roseus TaxID=2598579 RepID=UPI00143DBC24|nr:site-specific integrase [Limnoglobus roseus]